MRRSISSVYYFTIVNTGYRFFLRRRSVLPFRPFMKHYS